MKKVILFFVFLLIMGLFGGCSSDESRDQDTPDVYVPQYGDSLLIYAVNQDEVYAVYDPVSYQDNPEWVRKIIDADGKYYILFLYIFKGEHNGDVVYFIACDSCNSLGYFYDKNGEMLNVDTDYLTFFTETENWKMIYYFNVRMKLYY